ncbi:hypothetical protein [Fulvivirga lutimaris]|uniref:hypothetical protein n=1 Tax=Fulvivirga lutimaris TaxID=1819566 RepID=UPI0012BCA23A|nr:hypothetical protein [Fulvivirga lutimaris]MTI41552.1 hypothetical protein [Fulvivirga lutimaris]
MKRLQKIGGIAAISEAAIYIFGFITFGAIINQPATGAAPSEVINHLTQNNLLLTVSNLVLYVLFGVLLAPLVLSIYSRTKTEYTTSRLAAVFGFTWVTIIIASGMISNIGLSTVITTGALNPEQGVALWKMVNIIVEGLGGGNEIVGALWVILLSIAGLKSRTLPKSLVYYGILVGTFGMLTIFPTDIFAALFGLTQIVWFAWIGIILVKTKD